MIASSLEPVLSWEEKKLSLKVTHTVLAPELCADLDPAPIKPRVDQDSLTRSLSSSEGDTPSSIDMFSPGLLSPMSLQSPRPLPLFHAHRLLACGGPGFSLAVINSDTGTTEQLSVPLPQDKLDQMRSGLSPDDLVELTLHEISTMILVGEKQLWAGTSSGTLHVFELSSNSSLRLQEHSLVKINEPILSMASRPMEHVFSSDLSLTSLGPQTEVLLGVPYGYVVILAGRADQQGRLQDITKLPRKVVRLTDSSIDCAVNCITHVCDSSETYWCSCGSKIVVLQRRTWQKLAEINAKTGLSPSVSSHEVTHLLSTEHGVWSSVSNNSTVTLWDKTERTVKLHITVSSPYPLLSVTAMHCFRSLLIIGTERGDIIVFRINPTTHSFTSPTKHRWRSVNGISGHSSKRGFSHVASCYCGRSPILSIYTITQQQSPILFNREPCDEPSLIHILAVLGPSEGESNCLLKAFELVVSSTPSPCSTPSLSSSLVSNSSLREAPPTPGPLSLVHIQGNSDFLPLAS